MKKAGQRHQDIPRWGRLPLPLAVAVPVRAPGRRPGPFPVAVLADNWPVLLAGGWPEVSSGGRASSAPVVTRGSAQRGEGRSTWINQCAVGGSHLGLNLPREQVSSEPGEQSSIQHRLPTTAPAPSSTAPDNVQCISVLPCICMACTMCGQTCRMVGVIRWV